MCFFSHTILKRHLMELKKIEKIITREMKKILQDLKVKCSEGSLSRINIDCTYRINNEIKTYKTYRYKPVSGDIGNIVLNEFLLLSMNSDFLNEFERTESIKNDMVRLKERVKKEDRNSRRRHAKKVLI